MDQSDSGNHGLLSSNRAWTLFLLVVVYTFNFIDRQIVGIKSSASWRCRSRLIWG